MHLKRSFFLASLILLALPLLQAQVTRSFSVHFPFNAAQPDAAEIKRLDSLLPTLPEGIPLTLSGHTDSVASPQYNLALSQRRTLWVKDHLVGKGIRESQMTCNWFGERSPLGMDARENRRTEISWTEIKSPPNQSVFSFFAEKGLDTLTKDSVRIFIPPSSLRNKKGELIRGVVTVHFRNFRDRVDQIEADMSLDFEKNNHWYLYNSAGMFGIWALKGSDTLALSPGTRMRIVYPLRKTNLDLSFFKYIGVEHRWEEEAKGPSTPLENSGAANPETPVAPDPLPTTEQPAVISDPLPSKTLGGGDTVRMGTDKPPDSLGLDALPIGDAKEEDSVKYSICQTCECEPAAFIHHFASCISPEPPSENFIDLRFFYLGYIPPEEVHHFFCDTLRMGWIRTAPERKNVGFFAPAFHLSWKLPYPLAHWKVRSGAFRRMLKDNLADDIAIRRKPGKMHFTVMVKENGVTRSYRAHYLGYPDSRDKNETDSLLEEQWKHFLDMASERSYTLESNLRKYIGQSSCTLGLPYDVKKSTNPLGWLRAHQSELELASARFRKECAPDGCCRGEGDTLIPPPRDTVIPNPGSKQVLVEGNAIPIVLLDDFGMYNWDAIDSLPNPVWINTKFMDASGQPITSARIYLLIGEINGVIRMPWGPHRVRVSPEMRNQFVLIEENGTVHYCTAEAFRTVLLRDEEVLEVPCVTIPHKVGEPAVDLREVLPFE